MYVVHLLILIIKQFIIVKEVIGWRMWTACVYSTLRLRAQPVLTSISADIFIIIVINCVVPSLIVLFLLNCVFHSLIVLFHVLIVLFYVLFCVDCVVHVLFVYKSLLLPPGVNPIAVKYVYHIILLLLLFRAYIHYQCAVLAHSLLNRNMEHILDNNFFSNNSCGGRLCTSVFKQCALLSLIMHIPLCYLYRQTARVHRQTRPLLLNKTCYFNFRDICFDLVTMKLI